MVVFFSFLNDEFTLLFAFFRNILYFNISVPSHVMTRARVHVSESN